MPVGVEEGRGRAVWEGGMLCVDEEGLEGGEVEGVAFVRAVEEGGSWGAEEG